MSQNARASANHASSDQDSWPAFTLSDLLVVISQLLIRQGHDFPIPRGLGIWDSVLSSPLPTAPAHPANNDDFSQMWGPGGIDPAVMTLAQALNAAFLSENRDGQSTSADGASASTQATAASAAQTATTQASLSASTQAPLANPGAIFPGAILSIPAGTDPNDPSIRWYAVTVGKAVGVFAHWNSVAPYVVGARGCCYTRHGSYPEAYAAFVAQANAGNVRITGVTAAPYST